MDQLCERRCKIPGHSAPPVLELTPDKRHYGRWNCGNCGKFIVWARTPKNVQEKAERTAAIVAAIAAQSQTYNAVEIAELLSLSEPSTLNLIQQGRWRQWQETFHESYSDEHSN